MKKVFYSLLFCMCVMNIHAQLTLEATLPSDYDKMYLKCTPWVRINAEDRTDVLLTRDNTILRYSSSDFSLMETLNVVLEDGDDNDIRTFQLIPTGLYKNDGAEYYLISLTEKLGIYKRVGTDLIIDAVVINSFNNPCASRPDEYIFPTDIWSNGTKCFIFVSTNDGIKVYSFAGTASNVSQVKSDNTEMKPYPNPSHDKIHLTFDAVKNVSSIKVCDVNGRMIERIPVGDNATEYELDVHSYPEGVYFYEIDGKSQSFMVK